MGSKDKHEGEWIGSEGVREEGGVWEREVWGPRVKKVGKIFFPAQNNIIHKLFFVFLQVYWFLKTLFNFKNLRILDSSDYIMPNHNY